MSTAQPYVADIELYSGGLRVLPPGGKYGDPFEFSCGLRWLSHETVELTLVKYPPNVRMRGPIKAALRAVGAKWMVYSIKGRKCVHSTQERGQKQSTGSEG